MARKLTTRQADQTKSAIRTGMLTKKLQDHVVNPVKTPLTITQLRAADILLRKTLPDLRSTVLKGDPEAPIATSLKVTFE